jgi:hypothetical protein
VQEVEEDLEALLNDGVRLPPFAVDDEADAAGVVLVARIVEAGSTGRRVEHATAVFAVPESEVKYNDLIRSIHFENGSSPGRSGASSGDDSRRFRGNRPVR